MAQEAKVTTFKYVFIPADRSAEAKELTFSGGSDEALREEIRNYFQRGAALSEGQRREFAGVLQQKVRENAQKHATKSADAEDNSGAAAAVAGDVPDSLLAGALDSSSFEVVPVTMPSLANRFIGTSLYIDDAGRFKDLPLNDRASRIAQRDIRGDAFLLSNHDDPALDSWERVDCSLETFTKMVEKPPEAALDTSNQAAMAAATFARDGASKTVSPDDARAAIEAKAAGNEAFTRGAVQEATEHYTRAINLTSARTDLLPNEPEVVAARTAALLNRAQCFLHVKNWDAAQRDCELALVTEPTSVKAHFRLAKAAGESDEYDLAFSHLDKCVALQGADTASSEVAELREYLARRQQRFRDRQQRMFKKMFA